MLKTFFHSFIVLITLFLFCENLNASEQRTLSVTHKLRHIYKSDAKNSSGEFSLSRTEMALSNNYRLFKILPIVFSADLRQFKVNDDSTVDLPDTLQSKSINLGVRIPAPFIQREDLFIGVDLMPAWNSAADHSFADEAFRFNSSASLIFKGSEKFIAACGVWFRPQYESAVIPFFGVRYKPNEKLTFNFLSSEPNISYRITDKTKILLELAFLSSEFEVTSGARKGEVVQISDLEAGLGLEHDFNESIKGVLSIGIAFKQKYEYLFAKQKVTPEDSLYVGYRFNARF